VKRHKIFLTSNRIRSLSIRRSYCRVHFQSTASLHISEEGNERIRRTEKFPRPVRFWDTSVTILKLIYRFTAPTPEAYKLAQSRQYLMPVTSTSRDRSASTVAGN